MRKHHTSLRLTADKWEIKDFPKLPLATPFIRKALYAIGFGMLEIKRYKKRA